MKRLWVLCFSILLLGSFINYSCTKDLTDNLSDTSMLMAIPKGFPSISFPEGNEYTPQRWALGKRLFFDKRMSLHNTLSCASCHHPAKAFSDTLAFSLGDQNALGTSNAPTLANIAYHPYLLRGGSVPTIEMQILVPIQEHNEFNTNILDIAEVLNKDTSIVRQARESYGREIDAFVITRSIANYERSLISGNSPYDQFVFRQKENALSAAALRGKQLFESTKTNCSKCHSGFNFTNYAFENNGLHLTYTDSGRMRFTKNEADRAKFKVPTLRNIALTAPYMHDGSLPTLQSVITHYNSGGQPFSTKSDLIKPLGLTAQEQADLLAFLQSLTDLEFVTNKNFKQ